jgi:flagellar basal body rod protein FlgB
MITDNVTEILFMIIEFTHARQRILAQNIINIHLPGFIPKELEVEGFSDLLNNAIDEHIRSCRLVLCDTENIKFGLGGNLNIKPILDKNSKELLEENQEEYLKLQIKKLTENSYNQMIATELLRQKQESILKEY